MVSPAFIDVAKANIRSVRARRSDRLRKIAMDRAVSLLIDSGKPNLATCEGNKVTEMIVPIGLFDDLSNELIVAKEY